MSDQESRKDEQLRDPKSIAREQRIRRCAEALYRRRGSLPGSALDDWIRAEKEIREAEEQAIEQAPDESFPANDPPAN